MKKLLYWLPRILGIAFILFISIFALDVFTEGYGFLGTIAALGMHLIPSFVLALILFIAWKKDLIGSLLYCVLAVSFTFFFHTYEEIISFAIISGPPFLLSLLFLISSRIKK